MRPKRPGAPPPYESRTPVLRLPRALPRAEHELTPTDDAQSNPMSDKDILSTPPSFADRHIGPRAQDLEAMLQTVGYASMDALVDATVPSTIRLREGLDLPEGLGERAAVERLASYASENRVMRSLLGMGYHDCIVPPVIQRNVLENPAWYTQYTPYQAEIAQGRLEALINFQTLVSDLSGLPLANASLLDEATAAAEAMGLAWQAAKGKRSTFLVDDACHPQTIAVVRTRAEAMGITVVVAPADALPMEDADAFALLLQYPDTEGRVRDWRGLAARAEAQGALCIVATDLLALTLLTPPGELGAHVAVGSSQRLGVPMGFGGPHAAWIACEERFARLLPGRIVGVSKDADGKPAYRLSLQTREQHIRRDRATSNICTAQVLLAIMASMYAVYHGPAGLRRIATRIRTAALALREGLRACGHEVGDEPCFDTITFRVVGEAAVAVHERARAAGFNLRPLDESRIAVSLDERTDAAELDHLLRAIARPGQPSVTVETLIDGLRGGTLPEPFQRQTGYLSHPVFHRYHSEHEMLRYVHRLSSRDLSLTTSMIPLGSCTMKLNATSEMLPVTWPAFAQIHPFAPADQVRGYHRMLAELERWLATITGLPGVSLQPNAGSQGEYAGLLVIRAYHHGRGDTQRDVCLIPTSAHGTNPASAVMAGFKVIAVRCDERGNIDLGDLEAKASQHADRLGAVMITYPSTHGVFEAGVQEACAIIHRYGGQVYLDGANMNAQVGLCRPKEIGADVCHLNLHKTFCIPHGGGGPGMGPICVAEHLRPYLPGHPVTGSSSEAAIGPVSAAAYGSPSILPISWVYIAAMGGEGLRRATEVAILNANYMAARLRGHYDILYVGDSGTVAHELILDARAFKTSAGIEVEDIAKRLMDYGYHAPTMSWPVPGTLMVEPTESESREELDRFCDAMIAIREEIRSVEEGRADRVDNPLKNAPHTAAAVTADVWTHPYSRQEAAWPLPYLRAHKFWPAVARVDNAYGDRQLVCTCPPMEAFDDTAST